MTPSAIFINSMTSLLAMEIPKRYDWKEAEKRLQAFWEDKEIYKFDPKAKGPLFTVDTPPPTVSGKMHIGHAFSYAQQDFMVRFHRMKGDNVFYPFGTDDNGLATERLIESSKGVKSSEMPRKDYVKLCLETLEKELRPQYIADWKHLAISCDFSIFYTTINEHCQRISQRSFIELYKMGREYRKESPTVWCPECKTAIAQVEMEDKELSSKFIDIVFKVGDEELIIATTRPELLPACVAVFFHPDDKRYQKLKGKMAKVPLFDFEVPILPDERADPEKGTGIVMCCTFGDQTDVEWYKAHNLPLKIAISPDGKMTELAQKYEGMSIAEARKAILGDLEKAGLVKGQKEITHTVNVHERCGTEVEILNSKQWFIKYLDLKDDFLKAGKELNWYPDHMRNRYDNWIKGLQWDWCISRQRNFGVPFPVWYCKRCGEVILAEEEDLPVDPLEDTPKKACDCGSREFEPEKDVLDTWATSSLTPHLAIELFPEKALQKKLFPMSLRPQAHDIITFWLFNTVVKSRLHYKVNPWKDVAISGWALDPHGKKMSKSKGNIVEPQKVLEKYPVDALRFWAAGSKLGEDMPYQEKDLVTGVKTITKLWNASKFAFMHLADFNPKEKVNLELYDKGILSKMNKLIEGCTQSFEKYEYAKTKLENDKFFWQLFCDNYLEIAKDRLYNPEKRGEEERRSAQFTLYYLLLYSLKMFAPIMPYITEEIYQMFFKRFEKAESIHVSSWPAVDKKMIDEEAEKAADFVHYAVEQARRAKSSQNKSLKEPIKKLTLRGKITEKQFGDVQADIVGATHAQQVFFQALEEKSELDFGHQIKL